MGRARPMTGPDDPRHGTYAGYLQEYRYDGGRAGVCDRCKKAEVAYQAKQKRLRAYGRPRKVPIATTVRLLRELMALGWSGEYLALRLGVRRSNLPTAPKYSTVRAAFADAVKDLHGELSDRPGPSSKTRIRAQRAGWKPPKDWRPPPIDPPKPRLEPVTREMIAAIVAKALVYGTPLEVVQRKYSLTDAELAELVDHAQKESA